MRRIRYSVAMSLDANSAAPKSEEYFFLGWRPGQSVQASYGWGSCSTTVR